MESIPAETWTSYHESRDPRIREEIARTYQPLVLYVTRIFAANIPHYVDRDDLMSYGNLGLLDAIERYDVERKIKFQTYAMTRIRGAIIDGLRTVDWVPRSVRARARLVERTYRDLEAAFSRPPSMAELAEATSYTPRELGVLSQELSAANFVSLDDVGTSQDASHPAHLLKDSQNEGPEDAALIGEMKGLLAVAIGQLADHLRLVVTLYHYENLNFNAIAAVLHITESRVCQLYQQAMLALARVPA